MPRLNQKGFAHIFLIIFLLVGLAIGVYLVQQKTNILPKASEMNPSTPLLKSSEYDNPPTLITTANPLETENLLKEALMPLGYDLSTSESEDEIDLELNPIEPFTEEKAREFLNSSTTKEHLFYLRSIMWLLIDSFDKIPGPSIDPWYVLCDHLNPEILNKVGAEPTMLANGYQLACSDPPPNRNQFSLTDPHNQFIYRKIPAKTLVMTLETLKLERENRATWENIVNFIATMAPVIGPTLTVSAYDDPTTIANETLINSISWAVAPVPIFKIAGAGGKIFVNLLGPKLANRTVMVAYTRFGESSIGQVVRSATELSQNLGGLVNRGAVKVIIKLVPKQAERLESRIQEGLTLIKQGKYEDAVKFFEDSSLAKEFGVKLERSIYYISDNSPVKQFGEKEWRDVSQTMAYKSWFFSKTFGGPRIDQMSLVIKDLRQVPEEVLKDNATVHAEEWIHFLQSIRKMPLVGIKDTEIDVAVYMQKAGIDLPKIFLERHGREAILSNPELLSQAALSIIPLVNGEPQEETPQEPQDNPALANIVNCFYVNFEDDPNCQKWDLNGDNVVNDTDYQEYLQQYPNLTQ